MIDIYFDISYGKRRFKKIPKMYGNYTCEDLSVNQFNKLKGLVRKELRNFWDNITTSQNYGALPIYDENIVIKHLMKSTIKKTLRKNDIRCIDLNSYVNWHFNRFIINPHKKSRDAFYWGKGTQHLYSKYTKGRLGI